MVHNLKLKEDYIEAVMYGRKTFELRKDDRNYKVGDLIHFIDTNGEEFSAKTIEKFIPKTIQTMQGIKINPMYGLPDNLFRVIYVLRNVPEYGLDKDYCILGIKKCSID